MWWQIGEVALVLGVHEHDEGCTAVVPDVLPELKAFHIEELSNHERGNPLVDVGNYVDLIDESCHFYDLRTVNTQRRILLISYYFNKLLCYIFSMK